MQKEVSKEMLDEMIGAGAHVGYKKSRRHPSTGGFVFGVKNGVEIFDVEKIASTLAETLEYVSEFGSAGQKILLVGTKNEVKRIVRESAEQHDLPHVTNRWIGGTFTNWPEIKGRLDTLRDMKSQREGGEYEKKYTKKERLMLDREIESLEKNFGGIAGLEKIPAAIFVIDPDFEKIAVNEALCVGVPIIALANSDCDISEITHVIPGNDASVKSVQYFVSKVLDAYKQGTLRKKA